MTRPRARIVVVAVTLTALPGCFAPSSPDPRAGDPVEPPPITASALAEQTNAERGRAGLAALRPNARLMEAAQIQAEQIAAAGRLDHTLPDARFPQLEDRLAAVG